MKQKGESTYILANADGVDANGHEHAPEEREAGGPVREPERLPHVLTHVVPAFNSRVKLNGGKGVSHPRGKAREGGRADLDGF